MSGKFGNGSSSSRHQEQQAPAAAGSSSLWLSINKQWRRSRWPSWLTTSS